MKRLLIANRGEIAVRITRACREAGIAPLAVYSQADANSLHVSLADAAYLIGPGAASESYLTIDRIIEAARALDADAIHPGYGFLSENPEFAQACIDAELIWVGPPPSVISLLGDKSVAKKLMRDAGVPVVPGYEGEQSSETLSHEAERIGVPLLIKAAAGGGGRGMRIVDDLERFPALLDAAKGEAKAAFGDDRVLLERYVLRPHHVEFQIFGDAHGNVIHLFERECSIQRRHQKIIEESPSPVMTPSLRARMADAAVQAGKAAGYVGAGTVEFLVEPETDSFYFLEVNTRLQVEHPVTEAVTGLDLVHLQLKIADGEPLPITQDKVMQSGHAIEARIYAEDPAQDFLPSVGTVSQWVEPTGPGVRVDSGFRRGDEVSPYYDPMLAKLTVRAETRSETVQRMICALQQFAVLGVTTNLSYLLAICRHPAFQTGDTPTSFLADHLPKWQPSADLPEDVLLALAAEAITRSASAAARLEHFAGDRDDAWTQSGAWRNS